jgi:hypothetical protein
MIKQTLKKLALGAALAASAMVAWAPAQARDGRYRDGGDDAAIAVGAGILGLAVGAAIASGGRGHGGGYVYYNDGYGYPHRYYDGPRYRRHYYERPRYHHRRHWRDDHRDYRDDYRRDYDDRRDWRRDRRGW